MRGYVTISDEEKNSILQSHSSFYNGYSVGNVPSGLQPLLQDEGPTDKNGINVNNRGEVKTYSNHLVNESIEEEFDMDDFETELEFDKEVGSEDFSYSEDSYGLDLDSIISMFDGSVTTDFDDEFDYTEDEVPSYEFDSEGAMDVDLYEEEQCEGCGSEMYEEETCEQCGGEMREGECMECGSMYEEVDEDLRESFFKEKDRISEMFDRFKKFN